MNPLPEVHETNLYRLITTGLVIAVVVTFALLVFQLGRESTPDRPSVSISDIEDFVCPGECAPAPVESSCITGTQAKLDATCGSNRFRCCPKQVDLNNEDTYKTEGETCDPKFNADGSSCDGVSKPLQCVMCLAVIMRRQGIAYCVDSTGEIDAASGYRQSYIDLCGGFYQLGNKCDHDLTAYKMPGTLQDLYCKGGTLFSWTANNGSRQIGGACEVATKYTCDSNKNLLECIPNQLTNPTAGGKWKDTGSDCSSADSAVDTSGGGSSGGGSSGGGTSGGGTSGGGTSGGGTSGGSNGGGTPTRGSSCNAQLEQGEITAWVDGATFTNQFRNRLPLENVHVNCFTADGSGLANGATIKVTGPDYNYTINRAEARSIPEFTEKGTYSVQCLVNGQICNADSFTLGEGGGGDPNQICPGTNIQFEHGEITKWVNGQQLTDILKNKATPVKNVHINCFNNNGSGLLTGAKIRVTGPGNYVFTEDAAFARNIKALPDGEYVASCRIGNTVCDKERFVVGDVSSGNCGALDSNGDKKLTLPDLSAFASVYGTSCTAKAHPGCGSQDTDGDGKIELKDLSYFATKYNRPSCVLQTEL